MTIKDRGGGTQDNYTTKRRRGGGILPDFLSLKKNKIVTLISSNKHAGVKGARIYMLSQHLVWKRCFAIFGLEKVLYNIWFGKYALQYLVLKYALQYWVWKICFTILGLENMLYSTMITIKQWNRKTTLQQYSSAFDVVIQQILLLVTSQITNLVKWVNIYTVQFLRFMLIRLFIVIT